MSPSLAAARTAGTPSTSYSSTSTSASLRWAASRQHHHRVRVGAASAAPQLADAGAQSDNTRADGSSSSSRQAAKRELLSWINGTKRGSSTTSMLRGQIEEAQVAVEAFSPEQLDYELLEGKWRLEYTTALDVVPIVGFDPPTLLGVLPPPLTVGGVYQRFSSVAQGRVDNIIEFSVPFLLEEKRGVTFTVEASYEVRSPRRISLVFNAAQVGQLAISPGLEALLAPALLPRGSLNHQALLALKEFKLEFPFRSAQQVVRGAGAGASYLLTFLDEDMLIGRGPQGTFLFTRAADD